MPKWFEEVQMESNNYVSSRIRLSRNCADLPFPHRMDAKAAGEMIQTVQGELKAIETAGGSTMRSSLVSELPEVRRMALRERRILSTSIIEKKRPVGLMLSESEDVSVILNGDDHIRIQLLSPNFHLYNLWDRASGLDDAINQYLNYAFDERYGYLTAFPTNVGTGMRANVVVHLPALSMSSHFLSLLESMTQFGVTIRSVYGNGRENYGALYDICNSKTLGLTEREILDLVSKVASRLDSEENEVRRRSVEEHRLERVDETFKAYGLLKYARKLTVRDALRYLSSVMAGITDGIVKTEQPCSLYRLYLGVQPSNLIEREKGPVDRERIDAVRASYLRREMPELTEA